MANTHAGTFDGSGDWAEDSTATGLPSAATASTIEAWFKCSVTTGEYIAGFGSTTAYRAIYIESGTIVSLRTNEGKNTQWSATVTDGLWHHIAIVYPASTAMGSSVLCYIDGKAATYSASAGAALNTGTGYITIGSTPDHAAPSSSQVDEVRIWDDVRTAAEIQQNAGIELVGNEAGLVGYWKMNNDWTDETSNANDLTAAGNATFSTTVPWKNETQVSGSTYLTTSLVAYYSLEDTVDAHSTFDLTNNGSATFTTGKIDNAVSLVRASSQSLSNASITQLTGDFGFSAWINASTIPAASNYHSILARRSADTNGDYHLFLHGDISGKFNYQLRDAGTWKAVSSTTIPSSSTWYHVVVTKVSGTCRMYINGVLESTDSTFPATPSSSTADFYIGAATASHYWNGLIDETAVYSRALSYGDILDLYNGGSGITFTAPTASTFTPRMMVI